MRRLIFCAFALGALSACASVPEPDTAVITAPALVEAIRVAPPPPVLEPPAAPPRQETRRGQRPPTPQQALAAANRAARQTPAAAEFVDATLFYAYEAGALYELHTTPAFISTILLQPGETLIDIAAGDTTRWMVSNTVSGAGEDSRTLVMVKPQATGLRTNIVLVTNRRAYLIEAVSAAGDGYSAQVAWRYPAPPAPPMLDAPDPVPRAINDAYRIRPPRSGINGHGAPPWTPVRVFDDGFRTWIEFPADIAASDMPPLFVRTGEGAELVNYRVQGARYIVDRVFDVAELRLGRADPIVVRIERRPPSRTPRGRS
ncbi:MAG: TrbG/VirB9 family P-type conjugative transfer protein [Caulobacterales bacterium]